MPETSTIIPQVKYSKNIKINEDFDASHVTFVDNSTFMKPENFQQPFSEKQFILPNTNNLLISPHLNEVEFGCYETCYVCINGNADYILISSNNISMNHTWNFGNHNIEHGLGYLPKKESKIICYNNFTLCSIFPTPQKDNSIVYNFEILRQDTVLNKNINFAHVAYGAVSISDQVYTQQTTMYDLTENTQLSFAGESIVILGYKI